MIKKLLVVGVLAAATLCLNVRAQDTNAPTAAATTNAPDTTNTAPADTGPKPDPGGLTTGMSVDAQSPAGTFVVTAPTELTGDDLKDTNKVATFTAAKKAFD